MADLKLNNVTGMSESSSTITLGSASAAKVTVATGKDLESSTTGKLYSKGNCVQSSFHSSLIFGY